MHVVGQSTFCGLQQVPMIPKTVPSLCLIQNLGCLIGNKYYAASQAFSPKFKQPNGIQTSFEELLGAGWDSTEIERLPYNVCYILPELARGLSNLGWFLLGSYT